MSSILLGFYLFTYRIYQYLWTKFFNVVSQIVIVYYLKNNILKNITFQYYSGIGLDIYSEGIFYAKIFNINGTYHVAFDGELKEIDGVDSNCLEINSTEFIKRNEILLVKDEEPINIDLDFLDRYFITMKLFHKPISNVEQIMKFIGIKCSHVCQIKRKPFVINYIPISNVDIQTLYK